MGLDSYIIAKKYIREEQRQQLADVLFSNKTNFKITNIECEVLYWRKCNAIHNWFVRTHQAGIDNCQETELGIEDLHDFYSICKNILSEKTKAKDLLPTSSGFFFGELNYDQAYFRTLKETVKKLEELFKMPNISEWDFYYVSSW